MLRSPARRSEFVSLSTEPRLKASYFDASANIMLCTQGGERDVVKLLDFGLVKEFEVDRDALGAVAYYLLAGEDVFDGKSIVEVCSQHLHQEPEPLSARGLAVPAELEAVVLACLNKDPDRRPQTAAELRRRVEACSVQPWDSARALAWWREYQPDLDGGVVQSTGEGMTIAVDRAYRSSAELAG